MEAGEPYVARIRDLIRSFPEVTTVISQHGRPDDGTDPTGFFNIEFFAPLKPWAQWPPGMTKERLVTQLQSALALGLAETRAGEVDGGIDRLRRVVRTHPDRVEAWDCLLTALDESGQRYLRFVSDAGYPEIAEVMGTSEEAARRSVHEGLKRLRLEYEDD